MKKLVMIRLLCMALSGCLLSLTPTIVEGQGLIATMTEQLAKLELTLLELKQGYTVVQKGLTAIGDIKKGDFDLHNVFFTSLDNVSPAIKNDIKIGEIVAMQGKILSVSKASLTAFVSSGQFQAWEISYLTKVFSNLTDLTLKDVDELTSIVTDGKWQMTDDQRINRIDALSKEVSDKYEFVKAFSNRIALFAQQRKQGNTAIQNMLKMVTP